MSALLKTTLLAATVALAGAAQAQITFYEHDDYAGRQFTTAQAVRDFQGAGFNDRASSVVVQRDRWEICEAADFGGRCVVLRPGQYHSLNAMGLNDLVSSVRMVGRNARVDDGRYAPAPQPVYDARRRNNERLYQADVTSVRAVMGKPEQRCWVEQREVQPAQRSNSVPGGIGGALLGGIIGHQIGGGSGRNAATVVGAVGGAVVGSQIGKNYGGQPAQMENVQRCADVPGQNTPAYWDVTYNFRGQEHRVQMRNEPGATVTVNRAGEPRA